MAEQLIKNYIDEMLLALEANIEYLRQEGSAQLRLRNGRLLAIVGELYIYEFELEFFQNIEADSDVEIRIKHDAANGRVIAVNDKVIQVQLDKNLGASIAEAKLIISSYYLLQLLYDKLSSVKSSEIKLTDLAEKTFGLQPVHSASDKEYKIPSSSVSNLPNDSQEKALRLSLESEVSFIWGPPGTGKTETIARVIEGFILKDLSILLIAHTNVATDGALLDVVRHLKSSEDYIDGKFLREGSIQKTELKQYGMVVPAVVLEKKGLPIKKEIDTLTQRIEQLSSAMSASQQVVKQFERLQTLEQEVQNIQGDIDAKRRIIEKSKQGLAILDSQVAETDAKISRSQSMGSIGRFFTGLNLERITKEKSMLLIQKDKEAQKVTSNKQAVTEAEKKLEKISKEKQDVEEILRGENIEKHRQILKEYEREVKKLKEQRDMLQKQLDELADTLIKEAKIYL